MPKDKKDLIGTDIQPVPLRQKEIGIDTTQNLATNILDAAETSKLDVGVLESFSTVAQTREDAYTLIDTMSQDDAIGAILETYAEDATETNDSGDVIWCESSDENVAHYVKYLLDCLNVNKNAYIWAYNLIKYGDLYLRLYRESDYGDDLLFGSSKDDDKNDRTLNEEVQVNIVRKNDHYVHYVEAVANPGEMFELTRFGKTMGYIKAPVKVQKNFNKNDILNQYLTYKMKKNDVDVFDATSFVHACLEDNSSRTPEEVDIFLNDEDMKNGKVATSYTVKRGQSLLYNAFKIWRELTLLENAVLLNRITKSAIVRILNIDTGDMPKEQVQSFIQRLKEKIEQKSALNVGKSMTEYTNPGPIENIIYVPTHGGQGTITAQSLGGDVDVRGLADIDYFQNKLYGSLRVPKQFFAQTDDSAGFNGGSSLSIISSRYGKAIKRIQNTICQAVTDLVNLFLLDKGLKSYVNNFAIRMQPPLTQEELDRRENMRNRVGVISDIMSQIGSVVTDETLKAKIVKVLLSNSIADPDVLSLLQEQIDLLESKQEEKENPKPQEEEEPTEEMPPTPSRPSRIAPIEEPTMEPQEEETPFEVEGGETIEPIETGEESSYLPNPSELQLDMTNNNEF